MIHLSAYCRYFGRITLVALFSIALVLPSFAASPVDQLKSKAKQHYWGHRRDQSYSKALDLYLRAAKLGDAESQYISGGMYFMGLGTKKDLAKAFKLLHEAAINGKSSNISQKILAQAFMDGAVVQRNYKKALEWYTLSVENGNRDAQNELAYMYFTGNGVEQDIEKGTALFLDSAFKGSPKAQYNIGIIYYNGSGTDPADLNKAYGWIALSALSEHSPAVAAIDYLKTTLSAEELASGKRYAATLWEQVAR